MAAIPPIKIRVTSDTAAAEEGLDRVATKSRQTAAEAKAMGGAMSRTFGAIGGRGRFIINNTANQLGDMAVQLSMGTSAMRVMGFQLPQLLGGFAVLGGAAGVLLPILGAVAAIGFPIAAAFLAMRDESTRTTFAFGRFFSDVGLNIEWFQKAWQGVKQFFSAIGRAIVMSINRLINGFRAFVVFVGAIPEAFRRALSQASDYIRAFEMDIDSTILSIKGRWQDLMDFISGSQSPAFLGAPGDDTGYTAGANYRFMAKNRADQADILRQNLKAAGGAGSAFTDAFKDFKAIDIADYFDKVTVATEATAAGVAKAAEEVQSFSDGLKSRIEEGLMGLADSTKTFAERFRDMASSIIEELYRVLVVQQMVGSFDHKTGKGNGIMGVVGPIFGSMMSFDGGGSTGRGPRSGGIDGKGGFPAILHPNESVIDHTKGGMSGVVVNQSITIAGGMDRGGVRAEVMRLLPQINQGAKSAVLEAAMRGGSFKRGLT